MNLHLHKHRLISWLATLAILLNALVPSVSHAVVAAQGKQVPWEQICSSSGIKFNISPVAPEKSPAAPTMGSMQDCAYCSIHASSDFIASPIWTYTPLITAQSHIPHHYQLQRPSLYSTDKQARAPPQMN